jgi:hypothetical protein
MTHEFKQPRHFAARLSLIQSRPHAVAKILFPRTDFELSQRKWLGTLGHTMNETPARRLSMFSFPRSADLSNF